MEIRNSPFELTDDASSLVSLAEIWLVYQYISWALCIEEPRHGADHGCRTKRSLEMAGNVPLAEGDTERTPLLCVKILIL